MRRSIRRPLEMFVLALSTLALGVFAGCVPAEDGRTHAPHVGAAQFNQLSSGVGARVYHFRRPNGKAFAMVLVTGDDIQDGVDIAPNTEYWRMDPTFTPNSTFTVGIAWSGKWLTGKVANYMFHQMSKNWTAWTVARGFTLDNFTTEYEDDPENGLHLFSVYGPLPAGMESVTVDSYLEYHMQFDLGGPTPVIRWSLSPDSFVTFEAAQDYIENPQSTIASKWWQRGENREVLLYGGAKSVRIPAADGFAFTAANP